MREAIRECRGLRSLGDIGVPSQQSAPTMSTTQSSTLPAARTKIRKTTLEKHELLCAEDDCEEVILNGHHLLDEKGDYLHGDEEGDLYCYKHELRRFQILARLYCSSKEMWVDTVCEILTIDPSTWEGMHDVPELRFNLATVAAFLSRRRMRRHQFHCHFETLEDIDANLGSLPDVPEFDYHTKIKLQRLLEEWKSDRIMFPYRVLFTPLKGYIIVKSAQGDSNFLSLLAFTYGGNLLNRLKFPRNSDQLGRRISFQN